VFRHVKTVDIRNKLISKLYQHFRVRDHPCGLQDSLCTLTSPIVRGLPRSSLRSTLDTGGWLTLSRRGLAPRKRRRALLGAITPELSRPAKRVRLEGVVRPAGHFVCFLPDSVA